MNGKNVEYEIQFIAHNGSAFDTFIFLRTLSKRHKIANVVRNGKVEISMKTTSRIIKKDEKINVPQYKVFRIGMTLYMI